MHAARALNLQRKRREEKNLAKGRRLVAARNKNASGGGSISTVNTWYLEKLEERRAAVIAARRKAHGINLSNVFAILALIGVVFVLVSLFIDVPALLETGIFIFIIGTIFAVCCHFEGSEMYNFEEPVTTPIEDILVEIPQTSSDKIDELTLNATELSDLCEVLDDKKEKKSQVSPSRFAIEIIPEEPDEGENLSTENIEIQTETSSVHTKNVKPSVKVKSEPKVEIITEVAVREFQVITIQNEEIEIEYSEEKTLTTADDGTNKNRIKIKTKILEEKKQERS